MQFGKKLGLKSRVPDDELARMLEGKVVGEKRQKEGEKRLE